jgi:hypothetical protein
MLEFRENPTGFTVVIPHVDPNTNPMEDGGEIGVVPGTIEMYWYVPGERCLYQEELRQIADKLEELNNADR